MRYGATKPASTEKANQAFSIPERLLKVRGQWSGNTVEWNVDLSPQKAEEAAMLTHAETKALQKKHRSINLNTARILEVKRLMAQGKTQTQIIQKLRGRRGFGERMIKADMAALSKTKK